MKVVLTEQQINEMIVLEEAKISLRQLLGKYINADSLGISKTEYDDIKMRIKTACKILGVGAVAVILLNAPRTIKKAFSDTTGESVEEVVSHEENGMEVSNDTKELTISEPDYIKNRATSFHISNRGIDHILEYERFRSKPYNATKKEASLGIFTIGYGHKMTRSEYQKWKKHPYEISETEARQLFIKDLKVHEEDFIDAMMRLPKEYQNPELYSQGFIDACVSIVFNAGKGNFMKSPVYQAIKRCGMKDGKIMKKEYDYLLSLINSSCTKQKGMEVSGLKNRRRAEYFMAANDDYSKI